MMEVRQAALALVAVVAASASGCLLALPVGGVAAATVPPLPAPTPVVADSVPVGATIRWAPDSQRPWAYRTGVIRANVPGAWVVSRNRAADTAIAWSSGTRLEVTVRKAATRTRAFWLPFAWGSAGYFGGVVLGTAVNPGAKGSDLSEAQLGGAILVGLVGTAYGTWSGLRPAPVWSPVRAERP